MYSLRLCIRFQLIKHFYSLKDNNEKNCVQVGKGNKIQNYHLPLPHGLPVGLFWWERGAGGGRPPGRSTSSGCRRECVLCGLGRGGKAEGGLKGVPET